MLLIWLSLILFAVVLILTSNGKQKKIDQYFSDDIVESESVSAVNLKALIPQKGWEQFKAQLQPTLDMLGARAGFWVILFFIGAFFAAWYLVFKLLTLNSLPLLALLVLVFTYMGYRFLASRRRKEFENTFPDALNILMSAVTAGESLMHAISYVGKSMDDNAIGRQFKWMGDRLRLGETPEVVFQRACKNYPYPEFVFFTITMRANISRGGQLKGVLARLIRVLVDSRTLEKKKMAMTSEARISAKIVAAIPLCFFFLLNYINPSNVDFILYDSKGRYILYYVLGSEFLGLFIVWLLVKAVK
ncbi:MULTISPECIES: type II secretion system F family protein [unclassified Vibrio]|uniref:Type II secretion system F family protein n=1 Tax=Vibrio sp. HB236076 TaxID=3232307 RepID=A0AB39HHK1_9VIBR|nr:type II secretion system F family protein [Vibrio sp. HB161653]MDP5253172.1 type II secretion system F family protein [Vibrio sp. HB161653]